MTAWWWWLVLPFGGYVVGSIPFGWLVARARGVDIRRQGSGNVGATNVGRVLGRRWGVLVFVLDLIKGAAAPVMAGHLLYRAGLGEGLGPTAREVLWIAVGIGAILGSVAPVYLGFRGGKGVATSLGVVLGTYPYLTGPGLAAFGFWVLLVRLTGYVSLASILAVAALPLLFAGACYLNGWPIGSHLPLFGLTVLIVLTVLIRHRSNIGRLLTGQEARIGRSVS